MTLETIKTNLLAGLGASRDAGSKRAGVRRHAGRALVLVGGVTLLAGPGCAGWQATAKTLDSVSVILCDLFYKQSKPALSFDDVERAFCSTAEQVAPFLKAAKQAEIRGGAERQGEQ